MSKQGNCPFTRTKKNDQRRFNPPNSRVWICYVLHDDIEELHDIALSGDNESWNNALNLIKARIALAKPIKP